MWIRVPGRKISFIPALAGFLALAWLTLLPGPVCGRSQKEAPAAPAAAEIVCTGKVFTSLKRAVDLPFAGVITAVQAKSGQQVAAGEVLATYRLTPEALLSLRQRLNPGRITDAEIKLAEVERSQVPLKTRQQELTQLVQKKLASPESLNQLNRESRLVAQEHQSLAERLSNDRRTLSMDREALAEQLGKPLKNGQVPREAALKAPIAGHVIWVGPEMRQNAELRPMPGVFQVAVMDPMLVRANVFETEAQHIKLGDEAQITLESLPGHKFTGRVSRISWAPLNLNLEQPSYYDLEVTVPNPDLLLKEGLKARIVFPKSQ